MHTTEELSDNIRHAITLDLPELPMEPGPKQEAFVIVGSGPSLKDNLASLQRLQAQDAYIVCVNSAHDYLLSRGVRPNAMFILDASPTMVERHLSQPVTGITYYVSSHCPAIVFEALKGFDVCLVHQYMDREEQEILGARDKPTVFLTGMRSAVLRAYPLGDHLGYSTYHMFGVDSSYEQTTHVDHDETELLQTMTVGYKCKDGTYPEFKATLQMAIQGEDFAQMIELWKPKLIVHGEGFVPTIWAEYYDEHGNYIGC